MGISERDSLLLLTDKKVAASANSQRRSSSDDDNNNNLSHPQEEYNYSSLEQVDPNESIRQTHPKAAATTIPKLVLMAFFLAMSMGSTIGIVPNIMTQRFATLKYGYGLNDDDGDSAVVACHDNNNTTTTTSTLRLSNSNDNHIICMAASKDAQTAAAISELIANTLTLYFSSWVGSTSDVYGRRPFLILAISLGLTGPLALLVTVLQSNMSPILYYTAKSCCCNGLVHWMVIALSVVADVLEKQQRAAGVGLLMAGFWLGLCLAPTLAIAWTHLQVVMLSCVLHVCGLVCAVCWIPETLSKEAANQACEKQQQQQLLLHDKTLGHNAILSCIARPIRELGIINRNAILRLLATLAFFSGMATSGDQTLLLYYVDSVLQFTASDIAIMFLLVGGSAVLAQAVVLRPLNHCIGERWVLIVCFVAAAISNALYGLAKDRQAMYTAVCIGALSGMAFPTISAIKANNVDRSEQGRIQGALYSVQAVSAGIGPMAMRVIDATAQQFQWNAGSMFFFAAALQCIALICAYSLPKDQSNSRYNQDG
jgi:MFS transporter, DHA1 family, tetracycline resistance protein